MLKIKRLIAIYIDSFLTIIITAFVTNIITLGTVNLKASKMLIWIYVILFLFIFFSLILRKDLVFKNASIGKKICKLEIRHSDDSIPSKKALVKRIMECFPLFPLEIFSIMFYNQTSGDKKYKTKVVYKV